jgi:tRNA A-37 threonylcarbamoyl transferase component Bud32
MTTVIEAAPGNPIERSPSDLLRLVVAFVVLVGLMLLDWLAGDTLVRFAHDLLSGLNAVPRWILDTFVIATRFAAIALVLVGIVTLARDGGLRLLGTVVMSIVISWGLMALLEIVDTTSVRSVVNLDDLGALTGTSSWATDSAIAALAAALTAAAPWLSRRARRIGWAVALAMWVVHLLVSAIAFDSTRALVCGWLAGALTLVILGAPARRPSGQAIADGLAAVGVPLAELKQASVDARGSTPYFGKTEDGQGLFVKALGEDQRSADLLFRLYRTINRRDLGDERPFSSLRRAVEHEAMVALAARDLGIRTPRLVAFASAEPNSFVLAYEAVEGKSLDRVEPADMTDEVLGAVWGQVALMRRHRIAHRDMRLANIFLAADGQVWMIDFGFSELAASDLLLANDVAEFTASSSLKIGAERAVALAEQGVGPDAVASALDRLHLWALSGATRTGLKESKGLLDDLRARLSRASASR